MSWLWKKENCTKVNTTIFVLSRLQWKVDSFQTTEQINSKIVSKNTSWTYVQSTWENKSKFICPRRQFMLTSVSNRMTLNALSDHSLPRFHFRLEACWTKASTPWQWCCSWQEPPTYQLGDLQRKIKLFWTLNFIALIHTHKNKKAEKINTFKSKCK